MFKLKDSIIAYYLLAMLSMRYALKWKGSLNFNRRLLHKTIALSSVNPPSPTAVQEEGHQPSNSPPNSEEAQKYIQILNEHQSKAARLPLAEDVRTLVHQSIGFGVLSTNSQQLPGFPSGSVVGFQLDEEGKPFFVLSTMSAHTRDLLVDGRSSLVVTAKDFKGAAEGRVSIVGEISKVTEKSKTEKLRELYLARHKDAYWIDFGDFGYFYMNSIKSIRFVGGFARAGSVTPEEYLSAKPDPISAFADPVMKHMNEDHADSTQAMIQHYVGIPCTDAKIVNLDRLGMTVLAKLPFADGEYQKIRLPFVRPVSDRKQVKEVLVEMTKASAATLN